MGEAVQKIKILKPSEVSKVTGLSYEWALAFCKKHGQQLSPQRWGIDEEFLLNTLRSHNKEALV